MKTSAPAQTEQTRQNNIALPHPVRQDKNEIAFADNRSEAVTQRQRQEQMDNSPQVVRQKVRQDSMTNSSAAIAQRHSRELFANSAASRKSAIQRVEDDESLQAKMVAQRLEEEEPLQAKSTQAPALQLAEQTDAKPNNTGLPDQLKSGIESLSGISMDHVKVHYNSSQPAQLNAHAYAQGSEIHVAPSQEKHLPHEAWHVVQQAQGRVKPTMQMNSGVPVNDDAGLETEADVMGARANQTGEQPTQTKAKNLTHVAAISKKTVQAKLDAGGNTNPRQALESLVANLDNMHKNVLSLGAEATATANVDAFAAKLAALKQVAAGDDPSAQSAVLAALQKEMTQAGVPISSLANTRAEGSAVQRFTNNATVQRITGLEIVGTVIGIGALTYGIYRLCFGGGGGAAPVGVGYARNPIPIVQAGNVLQIAELERGSAPVVAFTGISSCLGIFRRNGGSISAVHLPLIDSAGNLVTVAPIPNLLAAANTALGGGGTFYLVGERDVWLGSNAGAQFAAINGAFGGAHHYFDSGTYRASIDVGTNETVITCDGNEVLRGT